MDCIDCSDPGFITFQNNIRALHDMFSAEIQIIDTIISNGKEQPISKYVDSVPICTFGADFGIRA